MGAAKEKETTSKDEADIDSSKSSQTKKENKKKKDEEDDKSVKQISSVLKMMESSKHKQVYIYIKWMGKRICQKSAVWIFFQLVSRLISLM